MAPFRIARPRSLIYFAVEGGLVFFVLYGLAVLTPMVVPFLARQDLLHLIVPAGALFTGILLLIQLGNPGDQSSVVREIVVFGILSFVVGIFTFALIWILRDGSARKSAFLLLEAAVAVPLVVAVWRWTSVRFALFNVTRERLLIVGTGEVARQVCRWIRSNQATDYGVVGFASETDERSGSVLAMGVRVQTDYRRLAQFVPGRVDRVIVALDEKRGKLPVRQLMEIRLGGVEIEEATSFLERVSGRISVETMLPSWLIFSEGFKITPLRSVLKRVADLFLSAALLVVTAPLMFVTAVLIKLDSRGPIHYRQDREGLNKREFKVLKFRSMFQNAESESGPTWALENDPRVTRVGWVIRRLRIDELPQLFNVFRGEMSFVGPRPERSHFSQQLEKKIPYYGLRTTVRPGITGWAQVEYRYGATDEDALEKLKYDLYYIKNNNLLFDLWIVLKTVKVVLTGDGSR